MGNKESRSAATKDIYSSIDPETQAKQPLCRSESSEDLLRNSWSPEGTPISCITSPNENNEEEENATQQDNQEQNDEHVPAPAARCNIVRLEENEEYLIKRHCFRDCTKKILRNRKKFAIVPFVLAFTFMVIFIVCILHITEMYWYCHFDDGDSNAKELFIPVGSVVDMDLTSLNISAKHINKLKVTLPNKSSPVRVTTAHEDHEISLPLNINFTLESKNSRCKSLLRYWKSREHITGNITLLSYTHPTDIFICYKWGNITNPPYCECHDDSCASRTFNISACFDDDDRGNDKHIIYIKFCLSYEGDDANIGININETYAIPNKTSYKSIYNDDTDNQNSAVLQFPSLLSELQHPSKLYINTHYKNTNDDCSEIIKLELKPDCEDAMEIMETVALVITAILSLLLSLMMFGIGVRCCCCHIKTGFCALGLFYEEPERQARQPLCQSDGSSSEDSYSLIKEETPEDFLQNSLSPEGTPVSSIITPNENNEEEENAKQQDDEHVRAPAARCNIVRLEENEEYPIKKHCFRDCTKKIFRNRKKCAIVPFVLALIFMVIFIVCLLRITEMYWYYHFGDDGNNTTELFIPVGSVVDMDLTSLNINAKYANKLKVTVPNKSSPVRVTTAHEDHEISLPLNINFTLNSVNCLCAAITRYWKSHEHITGDIMVLSYVLLKYDSVSICYKWGNITNPPSYCDWYDGINTFNISKYFDDDNRGNDKHIIYIQFCLPELARPIFFEEAIIGINITETYVIPNKTSYKSIYNDDTDNQNSAVLQFPSLLSELRNSSKLYINTKNTNEDYNEIIKLELQPLSSEDAMEITEIVALVITAILSLLLSLMMFGIGIRCCCCHIKTGFWALGLFYDEQ